MHGLNLKYLLRLCICRNLLLLL